jgi:hypothetical protein
MVKYTANEKQWKTIHRIDNDLEKMDEIIQKTVQELAAKRKYREFVSESHIAAYLYHVMIEKLPLGWEIMVTPTLSTKKRQYTKNAKNIPTFFMPDLVIYRKKTKSTEKKYPASSNARVRIDCDRKNSIAIELSLQRPVRTSNKELRTATIDFQKIIADKSKYRSERFRYHCIYVNQHRKTTLSADKFDQFAEICKENWFHYIGEDVDDYNDRLIYLDRNGNVVNSN